jgi:hypothetical protein
MEASLINGSGHLSTGPEPGKLHATPEARGSRAATVFAAIYLALVVGAPLIVRYGPSTDDHAMAALATRIEQPRCASAPGVGDSCPARIQPARDAAPVAPHDL